MPLMVNLRRAVVFGGERGEGLQKAQKLACFADELVVVSESPPTADYLVFPAGKPAEVNENLFLKVERRVPVHPQRAAEADLDALIAGATLVTSDLADRGLNERIAVTAHRHHVLCNIIDKKDLCDTWFMSLIETDHLIAGLSTKATATYYVTQLRRTLEPKFIHWEKQAAFLAEVRNLLPPEQRFAGLKAIWADPWVRLVLALGGPHHALNTVQKKLQKEKF